MIGEGETNLADTGRFVWTLFQLRIQRVIDVLLKDLKGEQQEIWHLIFSFDM